MANIIKRKGKHGLTYKVQVRRSGYPQQTRSISCINRPPRFRRVKAPDKSELEDLVQLISQRVGRCPSA